MQVSVEVPGAPSILLDDAVLDPVRLEGAPVPFTRRAFAASHLAMLPGYANVPHSAERPGSPEELAEWIDWDTSMAHRKHLNDLGFGIAEAMDTSQRFELGWTGARALLVATSKLGLTNGFIGAASSDQTDEITSSADLATAIAEQVRFIQGLGGVPIILPQLWLVETDASEDDYVRAYCDVIDASNGPILLHWLGEPFHPAMGRYFPGESLPRILAHDPVKLRGVKLSILDQAREERLRASIANDNQIILTGDDYNFVPLIEGHSQESRPLADLGGLPLNGGEFSHALLGIFNSIAVPAALAMQHLALGDIETYRKIMAPCEALSREIFKVPVEHYKAGVAFLAWLNGHQSNRMLVNHEQDARSTEDYLKIAELASAAGTIVDAADSAERLQELMAARPV